MSCKRTCCLKCAHTRCKGKCAYTPIECVEMGIPCAEFKARKAKKGAGK